MGRYTRQSHRLTHILGENQTVPLVHGFTLETDGPHYSTYNISIPKIISNK